MRRLLLVVVALLALGAGGALAAAPRPSAPVVNGQRRSESPLRLTFSSHEAGVAARAIRFRCGADAQPLKACRATFTVRLPAGEHVLRVQAVDPKGRASAITRVRVHVLAPTAPSYRVGAAPLNVIVADGKLWTENYGDGTVSVFDPATRRARSIRVGGQPGGIAAGAGAVWVSDLGDGTLTRIGLDGTIAGRIELGGQSAGLAVDGGVVYVADYSGGLIRVDASSNRVLGRTALPGQPEAVAVGFGRVWVTNGNGTLTALNPATGAVDGAPIQIGDDADDVAIGADAVWAVALYGKSLARVDPGSHAVTWRLKTPGTASGVLEAAGSVWVSNYDLGTVSRIDPAHRLVAKSYRVGVQPRSLAYTAGAIWVANQTSGTISRIQPPASSSSSRDRVGGTSGAAPTVTGPRTTGAARPSYRFRFPRAIRFLCAFDAQRLHRCANPYSVRLDPAAHDLRVRAVTAGGRLSAVASLRVVVLGLSAGPPLAIGQGPGRPALAGGSVWVPNGIDGTLVRVDASRGVVTSRLAVLPQTPPLASDAECQSRASGDPSFVGCRYVDSAFALGDDVWAASDYGGQLLQIDAASGSVGRRVPVAARPGGLAFGGGALWVFHAQRPTITRVDPATGAVQSFALDGVLGAGLCWSRGSLWVLSGVPRGELLRVDPATHAVTARLTLAGFDRLHPFKEAWSLACDDRTIWAANPNYNALTQVDAATGRIARPVRFGSYLATVDEPEGLDLAGNALWVAARTALARLDARTGTILGVATFPQLTQYTNVVFGAGVAWRTDFYEGTLTRVVLTEAAQSAER